MYRLIGNGIGKAYSAWAIVTPSRDFAFPAGIFASSDFSFPSVDAPTFYAVTGVPAKGITIEQGTITYDGAVVEGHSYFSPSGSRERIPVLPSEQVARQIAES